LASAARYCPAASVFSTADQSANANSASHHIECYCIRCVLLLLLAAAPTFAGPQACRVCHPAEFRAQSASHHAAAPRPAADPSLATDPSARPLRERSGIEYSYTRASGGVEVSITQGPARVQALLEWAFGAGAQAVTPVGRLHDRFFEHRISWYAAPGQAARTIGHPSEPSATPERALGMVQDA